MTFNFVGLAATLATFLGIWVGHVSVRKVESIAPSIGLPSLIYLLLGLGCEVGGLLSRQPALSAGLGILGITFLFDAFELVRQQRRVVKGHAPAHPENPRHAKILAENTSATTHDLLKREPVGRQVAPDEAVRLIADHDPRTA